MRFIHIQAYKTLIFGNALTGFPPVALSFICSTVLYWFKFLLLLADIVLCNNIPGLSFLQ